MILLIDKALKCDFFIFIADRAPKTPLQLEKEANDTCTMTNALRGWHEEGSGVQPGWAAGGCGPPLWIWGRNGMHSCCLKADTTGVSSVLSRSFQEA